LQSLLAGSKTQIRARIAGSNRGSTLPVGFCGMIQRIFQFPGRVFRCRRLFCRLAIGGLLGLTWLALPAVAGDELPPTLARSVDRGPIFLLGYMAVGGTPEYESVSAGYGVSILFRPQAAANLMRPLYQWNTGMVLQAEYRPVESDRRLLAGDLIFRRYLANMKDEVIGTSYFLGIGIGAAEITFPSGSQTSSEIWWTYLVEFGSERSPSEGWTFVLKGQWRFYDHNDRNYSSWSAQFGIGFPLPW